MRHRIFENGRLTQDVDLRTVSGVVARKKQEINRRCGELIEATPLSWMTERQAATGQPLARQVTALCEGYRQQANRLTAALEQLAAAAGGEEDQAVCDALEQFHWEMDREMDLAEAREARLRQLAAHRYAVENRGLIVDGLPVATDRQSRALMAAVLAALPEQTAIPWKFAPGIWRELNAAALQSLLQEATRHVQQAFTVEYGHGRALERLTTVAQVAAYDIQTGWPG